MLPSVFPRRASLKKIDLGDVFKVCGISGIITRGKMSAELRQAALRMNQAQIHRGPDGMGEFSADHITLAMSRLAIIDPAGGWQPIYNEDKSLVLIVNGEIYNYLELRQRLSSAGHKFKTEVDGEVILHLYEENDQHFISHLRGMFAFALWDVKRQRLILARDRMGEKPLYLYERDGVIVFASELKALLHSGLIPFELNPHAVNLYFHYQYVPEPLTAVKGVRKLDAARMFVIDVPAWEIDERTYWKMEDAPPLDGNPSLMIREKLEEVSDLVVRSDVPIGVALSGGLDSSIVAAFAALQKCDSLSAFSVGYAGRPACDEREAAAAFARHLNLPLHEVELNTQSIVDFFPQLNYWRDDPIADISGFGYYAVMKLAHERGVPVMLQGQGGDELFWGYSQVRAAAYESLKKAALLDNPFSQTARQILDLQTLSQYSREGVASWMRDFGGLRSGWHSVRRRREHPERMIFYDLSVDFAIASAEIRNFYSSEFLEQITENDASEIFSFPNGWTPVETTLTRLVCDTYLRENGITQGDRLGMASSVEMRLPLVDYQLVETIIGLRKSQPDSHLPPKHWLRNAVADVLPDWVLNRPKRGFEPPVHEWHRALFSAYGDSLPDGFLVQSKILSRAGALRLAEGEFPSDAISPLSFKALVLEQWCRQMQAIP